MIEELRITARGDNQKAIQYRDFLKIQIERLVEDGELMPLDPRPFAPILVLKIPQFGIGNHKIIGHRNMQGIIEKKNEREYLRDVLMMDSYLYTPLVNFDKSSHGCLIQVDEIQPEWALEWDMTLYDLAEHEVVKIFHYKGKYLQWNPNGKLFYNPYVWLREKESRND